MEIKNNTSNVTSFRGNFILAKTLSKGEAELVENFNKIIYKKKNNLQVLKRKSYDIFVKKNDKNPELLELTTYYTIGQKIKQIVLFHLSILTEVV